MVEKAILYQNFLKLSYAIEELTQFPKLSPDERELLNKLNSFWIKSEFLKVIDSVNLIEDSSASSTFKRLKNLRKKGYVDIVIDENDNRVKYVHPSQQTNDYFATLGSFILESVKSFKGS